MSRRADIPIFGGPNDGGRLSVLLDTAGRPPETAPVRPQRAAYADAGSGSSAPELEEGQEPEGEVIVYRLQRAYNPYHPEAGVWWRYVHPDLCL